MSSIFSIGSSARKTGMKTSDWSGSARSASMVRITASASITVPSENMTPSRTFTSHDVKSSLGVQLSVRLFCQLPSVSTTVSVSKIAMPIRTGERLNGLFVGLRLPASFWSPTRSTPPRVGSTSPSVTASLPSAPVSAPGESSPLSPESPLSPASSESSGSVGASASVSTFGEASSESPAQADATSVSVNRMARSRPNRP